METLPFNNLSQVELSLLFDKNMISCDELSTLYKNWGKLPVDIIELIRDFDGYYENSIKSKMKDIFFHIKYSIPTIHAYDYVPHHDISFYGHNIVLYLSLSGVSFFNWTSWR